MTALHPAKHPRDGPQVFQAAALLAARGTRADARMLQFVHWSGLLEIFDHLGVLGDVVAIESEGFGGHLLHRWHPTLVGSGPRASGARDRLHARRDHDLKIPLGENGI